MKDTKERTMSGSSTMLSNDYTAAFSSINERPVDDISLEFFYKPHTITLLAVSIASVIYTAFVRDESSIQDNIWSGICCVVFFFLIVSVLTFPNGPFTRPHPAVWRIVFGTSVLYLLALLFLLFQSYSTVYEIMYWIDPNLRNFHIDMDKVRAFCKPNLFDCDDFRDISSTTGKIKRAILQFTPVQWTPVRWLDPTSTYMRFCALSQLVVFWQISELNTFFLKHIFEMPPSHPLVIARLCLIGVIVAPSVRQYYTYVTDPNCKRVGTQCWVYGAIMVTESMLCIKNGKELFGQAQVCNVIVWLVIQILVSIGCVYGVVLYHRYFEPNSDSNAESPKKID
ncbi:phosphatidylserine synthase 1 [Spodoptera litura]|uniref:Phosphatidylserine synthase n=1 Tax=Spodoptera litura TaxID=69820 RepID=A0A9J7DYG8_SPOLT|nr:phosphatidylserine synthase 1 [Spodoptera litura]